MEERSSLYKRFTEERCPSRYVYETEDGFAMYEIEGDRCYIIELYVLPEKRRFGTAKKICEQVGNIARQKECRVILGSWDPRSECASLSLKAILALGLKPLCIDGNLVFFIMEL